jgi:hypothetical protein
MTQHTTPPCTVTTDVRAYLKNGQCGKEVYQNSHDPKTWVVCMVHPQSLTSITEQKNKPMKDTHTHTHKIITQNPQKHKNITTHEKKNPALQCYHPMLDMGFGYCH